MMRFGQKPVSLGSARDYFFEEASRSEYYTEQGNIVGKWVGKGAEALGLADDVSQDDFIAALKGINPTTGAVIVNASTRGQKEHVSGWDCAFSAPKSVSIQALVGGDRRLIEAHNRAVAKTLPEIEAFALCHQQGKNHGHQYVVSGNIVGAAFNHFAARPSEKEGLPDPHLHTHVVIMNMTQRPSDGEWRALHTVEQYCSQTYGSALYLNELSQEVQKLGYRIQITESHGKWELEGYTRDQVQEFSQRQNDIKKYLADHNLRPDSLSTQAAHIGRMNTRAPKGYENKWTLEQSWRERAAEVGIPLTNHLQQAMKRGPSASPVEPQALAAAVEYSRTHTTEREAVVDRRELERHALQHGMGRIDLADVRAQMAVEQLQGKLIRTAASDSSRATSASWWDRSWHPQGAFTTDEMLKLEQENLEMVRAGIGKAAPISDSHEAISWALHKGLLPDQITVAAGTLASNHRITAIEGAAGTTKTYTVGAVRELAESKGYTVRGFGMTSGSVEALREAGINAQTIASLLHNPLPLPEGRELWFIDESSLISTRYANQLFKAGAELDVARIVFVGDQYQHVAIEAGAPVKQFLRDNMACFELTVIRRQKDPELKRAVELARKQPGEALHLLEEQQRVTEIPDVDARYQRIALDYLRSHEQGHNTLVVSPGNDERRELNKQIRKLLVDQGQVNADGIDHAILVNRNLTKAQRQHAGAYQEGDVIQFKQGAKGISRDSYLQVAGVDWDNNTLTLHGRDGANIMFNPAKVSTTQVYQWEHRELAVGDRVEFRAHLKKDNIANHAVATIRELNQHKVKIEFDSGREMVMPLAQFRHIDHGYCSTDFSKQGHTVDNVIVNLDTLGPSGLVNRQVAYVGVSRGRLDAQIFTNDKEALRRAIARDPQKEIALDAVQAQQAQQVRPPQPQQSQSMGMRI